MGRSRISRHKVANLSFSRDLIDCGPSKELLQKMVFDFLAMIPNELDSGNSFTRFLARFCILSVWGQLIFLTLLYAPQYLFVLLRPKKLVKLSTQSADKWMCMGKWPVPGGAIYFHQVVVARLIPEFVSPTWIVS